jgi:hypothetical protein
LLYIAVIKPASASPAAEVWQNDPKKSWLPPASTQILSTEQDEDLEISGNNIDFNLKHAHGRVVIGGSMIDFKMQQPTESGHAM